GKEHVAIAKESAASMWDIRRRLGRNPYFKKQADGSLRHTTQILGDWGIEFLRAQKSDQPFCLQISCNATHAEDGDKRPGVGHFPWPRVMDGAYDDQKMPLPALNDAAIYESQPDFLKKSLNRQRFFWRWDTPEKYQTNMRAYFRMLSGIDHVMGRLVTQLRKQGLAENTIIIYSADNGFYLGDRGFAGKWTHYDQSLRIPLIVFDPRAPRERRGVVQKEMALNSDLGSTILELAGLPSPASHTGRSLLPILRGKTPKDWRRDFLCEFIAVPRTIPRWEGVRDREWLYARYFVDGPDKPPFEFVHDLRNDPQQLVNVAALSTRDKGQSLALTKLRKRCDELVAANGLRLQDLSRRKK
ncbi:MAG: sulfatase-like hydrolase/transferase, partial [Verrucomicrobiota bacterium]|nr:sulfatase-like hydrolase/transferase [Verrucomicrobiota bacterium]